MAVAAVPQYLRTDTSTASPGFRFGLLLPIWTDCWEKDRNAGPGAWSSVTKFCPDDERRLKAVVARQAAMADIFETGHLLTARARSTAPFSTGLGIEHPLENGFAFLNPYGLPYLPGSGVKGVLRRAAQELASGEWGPSSAWGEPAIRALFGSEDSDDALRGALSFWDAFPSFPPGEGPRLVLEIMTAHHDHYLEGGGTPHESGRPNPITFLSLPPGTAFAFHVQCDRSLLRRSRHDLLEGETWQALVEAAFTHAFSWLGFGAKTAVGYGAMTLTAPVRRVAIEPTIHDGATLVWQPGSQTMTYAVAGLRSQAKGEETVKGLFEDPAAFDRLKSRKKLENQRVKATIEGNQVTIRSILRKS